MRISDWSSDVCSSDLITIPNRPPFSKVFIYSTMSRFYHQEGIFERGKIEWIAAPIDWLSHGYKGKGIMGVSCRCRRSEEHTSELQSLMRISYAVFCLKKKNNILNT